MANFSNALEIVSLLTGAAGAIMATWSFLHTRKRYYDDYKKNRRNPRDS